MAVLAGILLLTWGPARSFTAPLLQVLPVIVLVAGLALGWRFGRGRLVAGLLLLAAANTAVSRGSAIMTQLIALALPINLALLAFLPEGSVTSRAARAWAVFFAIQAAVIALLASAAPSSLSATLSLPVLPWSQLDGLRLPQFAMLAFAAGIVATAFQAIRTGEAGARGLFWTLVATFVALAGSSQNRTLIFAVGGVSLVIAMVESSYALAFHDDLTGLPGRRAFNQALGGVRGSYAIAMVDVDHFKQFNDRHGHDVGDQVLKLVANRLAAIGGGGRSFRYGGEEFSVIFPAGVTEAEPHLEALRANVEATTFMLRGRDRPRKADPARRGRSAKRQDISVTISIGAAEPGTRSAPAAVVKAADKALYEAKAAGRNRLMLAG